LVNLRERHRGCALTIGAYDGLHLGHQALIRRLAEHGARLARPTMLLTFEPIPREFFTPENPPSRLTSLRERWRMIERMGLNYFGLLSFNERLRNMTGETFAQLLAQDLKVAQVIVGHDFKFGRGGEATAQTLQEVGRRLGFDVEVMEPVLIDGVR